MAFRPTLRPVDWSDVDSRGRYLRRKRSLEEESGEEDPQVISPTNDKSSSPPRKRKKSLVFLQSITLPLSARRKSFGASITIFLIIEDIFYVLDTNLTGLRHY